MRKLWFAHLARALVAFPGGFGTLDELTEIQTLAQTRKLSRPIPVILYGPAYWKEILNFEALRRHGTIAEEDLRLFEYAGRIRRAHFDCCSVGSRRRRRRSPRRHSHTRITRPNAAAGEPAMSLRLTFLGAAGAVTGSKYLLQVDSQRLLIDCELFQGLKRLRERNWQPLPFDPRSLGAAALYRGRCARGAGAAASGGTARDGRGRGPAARELLFGGASSRRSVDSHRGAG